MNSLPENLLPETLRVIAEICGEDVMMKFWKVYGGCRVYIPERLTDSHVFAQNLGFVEAKIMCDAMGGEFITVPKASLAMKSIRNQLIVQAKLSGVDNGTLARRFDLTDRQIIKICGVTQVVKNYDLFDDFLN